MHVISGGKVNGHQRSYVTLYSVVILCDFVSAPNFTLLWDQFEEIIGKDQLTACFANYSLR